METANTRMEVYGMLAGGLLLPVLMIRIFMRSVALVIFWFLGLPFRLIRTFCDYPALLVIALALPLVLVVTSPSTGSCVACEFNH